MWLPGVVLLAGLVVVVARAGDARRFAELARDARPAWLLAAIALQVGMYVCAAAVWRRVLVAGGAPQPLRALAPLGVAKLFVDQALPAGGLGGTLLVVRAMARRGVPVRVATAAMLLDLLTYYGAFAVALSGALVVLRAHRDLHPAVLALAGTFALVTAAIPGTVFWLHCRDERTLPPWARRIPGLGPLLRAVLDAPSALVRDRGILASALGWQLAVIALDALTMSAVLRAIGEPASLPAAFASSVVGSIAALVGVVPGGLGTYEAAAVAMMRLMGIDVEPALTATLLHRGLSLWLPLVPGVLVARREFGRMNGRRAGS
jgi:uncharacterized membrane protein YbhN (UPF0104 family)